MPFVAIGVLPSDHDIVSNVLEQRIHVPFLVRREQSLSQFAQFLVDLLRRWCRIVVRFLCRRSSSRDNER